MLGSLVSFYQRPDNFRFHFFMLILCMSAVFILYRMKKSAALYFILISFFLVGTIHTGFKLHTPDKQNHLVTFVKERTKATVTGKVLEMPEYDGKNTKLILTVDGILIRNSTNIGTASFQEATGKVRLTMKGQLSAKIAPGTSLMVITTLKKTYNYNTPGTFDYVTHMANQSIYVTGWINSPLEIEIFQNVVSSRFSNLRFLPEQLRYQTALFLKQNLDSNLAGMYMALLLGSKSMIPKQVLEQYKKSGVMHLLAISGIHMALLGLIVNFCLLWLLKRSSWLMLRFHVPTLAALLSLVPIMGYALIAGMNTPVLRAAVMASLVILALALKRQHSFIHILAATVLVLLAFKPLALFTVSFQLSFSAVLTLSLITPRLMQKNQCALTENNDGTEVRKIMFMKSRLYLQTAFLISIAASLGTLPFLLFHFNRFSPIGPILNLVIEPFLCLWALPFGLIATPLISLFPNTAIFLLKTGGIGITIADYLTVASSSIPWSSLWTITPSPLEIGLYYVIAFFWLLRDRIKYYAYLIPIAIALLLFVFTKGLWLSPSNGKTEVTFLDVGQGTSTFIQLPQGETILLDGGSYGSSDFDIGERIIAPFLWKKRIWQLDKTIITHPDSDHYSGMAFIQHHFKPKKLYTNQDQVEKQGYTEILSEAYKNKAERVFPLSGQIIAKDNHAFLQCLGMSGLSGSSNTVFSDTDDSNDSSLVFKLQHGTRSFLFPGDISTVAEAQLVAANKDLNTDVLLSPHHGSRSSSSALFMDAVSPEIVVVSAGNSQPDHFPNPLHLARWKQRNIETLLTSVDGTLTLTTDGRGLTVDKYLTPDGWKQHSL